MREGPQRRLQPPPTTKAALICSPRNPTPRNPRRTTLHSTPTSAPEARHTPPRQSLSSWPAAPTLVMYKLGNTVNVPLAAAICRVLYFLP